MNETAGGVVKNVECKVKLGKNGGRNMESMESGGMIGMIWKGDSCLG